MKPLKLLRSGKKKKRKDYAYLSLVQFKENEGMASYHDAKALKLKVGSKENKHSLYIIV